MNPFIVVALAQLAAVAVVKSVVVLTRKKDKIVEVKNGDEPQDKPGELDNEQSDDVDVGTGDSVNSDRGGSSGPIEKTRDDVTPEQNDPDASSDEIETDKE